jgi:polar amino acid transport system substrate-binding protein
MRTFRPFAVLVAAACSLAAPLARAAGPSVPAAEGALPAHMTVRICEDDAEWPPFTYYERTDGRRTSRLTGIAVDAVDRILKRAGLDYTLDMLPWQRCLQGIQSGAYHMALNVSYSEERGRQFWFARPLYSLNSHYFYSRRVHPQGLPIQSIADFKRFHVCGLIGYNYTTYGLEPSELDLSPSKFTMIINKVLHDRCDLFIEKREVIAGFAVVDPEMAHALANPDLVSAPVPGVPPTPFSMIVTRAHPWAPALLQRLDAGVVQLEDSGELRQITAKYLH